MFWWRKGRRDVNVLEKRKKERIGELLMFWWRKGRRGEQKKRGEGREEGKGGVGGGWHERKQRCG